MISQADKEKIKTKAVAEIASLQEAIINLKKVIQPVSPDVSIGRLTRLEAINSKNMNEENLRAAIQKISSLEAAISRIAYADFGLCDTCDKPIPLGRLMLLPFALTCVKCLEGLEED
ncbi:MAG: TraR/DksA C4-type zinc finger protein [SAR324 cluster bacterium]|nr:TraR/DksA C4-type zinc finger protein [SAR324 cluster bacterium]